MLLFPVCGPWVTVAHQRSAVSIVRRAMQRLGLKEDYVAAKAAISKQAVSKQLSTHEPFDQLKLPFLCAQDEDVQGEIALSWLEEIGWIPSHQALALRAARLVQRTRAARAAVSVAPMKEAV